MSALPQPSCPICGRVVAFPGCDCSCDLEEEEDFPTEETAPPRNGGGGGSALLGAMVLTALTLGALSLSHKHRR